MNNRPDSISKAPPSILDTYTHRRVTNTVSMLRSIVSINEVFETSGGYPVQIMCGDFNDYV